MTILKLGSLEWFVGRELTRIYDISVKIYVCNYYHLYHAIEQYFLKAKNELQLYTGVMVIFFFEGTLHIVLQV